MQFVGTIFFRTFFLHHEVLTQCVQELFGGQAVEILHYAVVVDDGQLVGRETYGHEIIIFFVTFVVGVLLGLFCANQCCGSRTMVSVGNVECGHGCKFLGDGGDVVILVDNPESVSEAVDGCDEVIHRLFGCIACHDVVQHFVVGISKEHRFDVGIVHTHVFHAVFFLVAAGEFMLFDNAVQIVVYIGTYDQTVLCLAIHGLGIDIIVLFAVLHQPSFVLEHLEVFGSFGIHARVVLVGTFGKINLRFDDVIQRLFITFGLFACFFGV